MCPCDFLVALLHAGEALDLNSPFLSLTSAWIVAALILVLVFLVFARSQQHFWSGNTTDDGCEWMFFGAFVSMAGLLVLSESLEVFFFTLLTLIYAYGCEYKVWHDNILVEIGRNPYAPKSHQSTGDYRSHGRVRIG